MPWSGRETVKSLVLNKVQDRKFISKTCRNQRNRKWNSEMILKVYILVAEESAEVAESLQADCRKNRCRPQKIFRRFCQKVPLKICRMILRKPLKMRWKNRVRWERRGAMVCTMRVVEKLHKKRDYPVPCENFIP